MICCNVSCPIVSFHLPCLPIVSIPKTWYCPRCRILPQFKRSRKVTGETKKMKQSVCIPHPEMSLDCVCICKLKPSKSEKLLECHSESRKSGRFFHYNCLYYKRMPTWICPWCRTTWICPWCRKKVKGTGPHNDGDVSFIQTLHNPTEM